MTQISNPIVNIKKMPKGAPVKNTAQKVLVLGQMLSGTGVEKTLYTEINNNGIEKTLFGKKSHIAGIISRFKKYNPHTRLDCIALENTAGTSAEGTVAFTNNATSDGLIDVFIGEKDRKYSISVVSGMTPTLIGDALVSEITADETARFTAVNTVGVVVITASNKGIVGNNIGLAFEKENAEGVVITLTAFSGGATPPPMTGVMALIGDTRYQTIVFPNSFDKTELKALLRDRWNYDNKILDGVAVICYEDTLSTLKSNAIAENTQNIWHIGDSIESHADYIGGSIFTHPDLKCAEFCAIRALRLTEGTDLSLYSVGATAPLDLFGGIGIASKPYHETPLYGLPISKTGFGFSDIEVKELKTAGVIVLGNNKADNGVVMGSVVTTYQTDAGGNPDSTYHFGNIVDSFSNIAEYKFNNFKRDYAQYRITNGETTSGRNIANEKTIRGSLVEYYVALSKPEYVLTQGGEDATNFYSKQLEVTLNLTDGKVLAVDKVPIVSQLRQLDNVMYATF